MTDTVEQAPAAPEELKGIQWGTVAIWGGILLILAVLGWGLLRTNAERPDNVAPDFEVQFFNGYEWEGKTAANLSDFKGQPVILNFWASWCAECRIEADLLEDTWRAYRDEGVVFLGVAYVDVEPKSIAYLEEFDITYPNGPDLRSSVSSKYEITGVPETFFIDREGKISHIQIGPVSEPMLIGLIDQLLANEETSAS
jgi:cytochrome c biogenesis protein CcmG/thiol:disulfide interchange protein DsbE